MIERLPADVTLDELQSLMDEGALTAEELVYQCLDAVAERSGGPQGLNAIIEVNPDAAAIAAVLDQERKAGRVRGPLHGIPVVLKDNIDTGDHQHTSAGSLALAAHYAARDAHLVRRLRHAGAVILGKAGMTEWANFMTEGMPNGYSSRGGQVLNACGPFDAGGSSSGSASAVSGELAPLAVGTETSGSILSPASQQGVVGLKPTLGYVSRSGIIPIAHSQDTAGPIARSVRDALILLRAIVGGDRRDPVSYLGESHPLPRPEELEEGALQGRRFGVPRDYLGDLPAPLAAGLAKALQTLQDLGATVVDPAPIPSAGREWGEEVLFYEFKADLNAYLGHTGPDVPVHSLRELIFFNERNRRLLLRYGQTLLLQSEATSGTLSDPAYLRARRRDLRWSRQEGIDHALAASRLDALLFPNNYGADIAARAGYPSICVPAGVTSEGVPFALTFCGTAFAEAQLVRFGYAYEQATRARAAMPLRHRSPTKA
jgi:amidase